MANPTDRPIQAATIQRTLQMAASQELLALTWSQLEEHRQLVTEAFAEFRQWHTEVRPQMTTPDSCSTLDNYYLDVQNQYVDARARIGQRMRELEVGAANHLAANPQITEQDAEMRAGPSSGVAEPSVFELPFDIRLVGTFDGKYHDWREFKQRFEQHIVTNAQMSEQRKLRILRAVLVDRAHAYAADGAEVRTFEETWEHLVVFYDNTYRQRIKY